MKTFLVFLLLCCCALPSSSAQNFMKGEEEVGILDGHGATKIWWSGWSVSSSEELWAGQTLKGFPLTNLLDGDPRTAWAYGGTGQGWKRAGWRGQYALEFRTNGERSSVAMDSLRILNGYNRRRDLFERNDRVVEMQVWINDKLQKTVRLSDSMSWHNVTFPNQLVRSVGLLFTGIRKGAGPDNDLCVSELAFFNGTRKINMEMPNVVMFYKGNKSGDAPFRYEIITRKGNSITGGVQGNVSPNWSYDKQVLAGAWKGQQDVLWAVDANKARLILRHALPMAHWDEHQSVYWAEKGILEVLLETDFDARNRAQSRRYRYKVNVS